MRTDSKARFTSPHHVTTCSWTSVHRVHHHGCQRTERGEPTRRVSCARRLQKYDAPVSAHAHDASCKRIGASCKFEPDEFRAPVDVGGVGLRPIAVFTRSCEDFNLAWVRALVASVVLRFLSARRRDEALASASSGPTSQGGSRIFVETFLRSNVTTNGKYHIPIAVQNHQMSW